MDIESEDGKFERSLAQMVDGEKEGRGGAVKSKAVRPPGMGRGLILFASEIFPVVYGWSTGRNEGV